MKSVAETHGFLFFNSWNASRESSAIIAVQWSWIATGPNWHSTSWVDWTFNSPSSQPVWHYLACWYCSTITWERRSARSTCLPSLWRKHSSHPWLPGESPSACWWVANRWQYPAPNQPHHLSYLIASSPVWNTRSPQIYNTAQINLFLNTHQALRGCRLRLASVISIGQGQAIQGRPKTFSMSRWCCTAESSEALAPGQTVLVTLFRSLCAILWCSALSAHDPEAKLLQICEWLSEPPSLKTSWLSARALHNPSWLNAIAMLFEQEFFSRSRMERKLKWKDHQEEALSTSSEV